MYHYLLPPTNDPDYMIVLDASHAEAFKRACTAAQTTMGMMAKAKTPLAVLKTNTIYSAGSMDLAKGIATELEAVDDFGAQYILSTHRATIIELRNMLNGSIRVALNNTMLALQTQSLYLIFYLGGPLFIVRQEDPKDPFRIALVRFEGANDVEEEHCCVEMNRASKAAYQLLWGVLEEEISKKVEQNTGEQRDIIDDPISPENPATSYPKPSYPEAIANDEGIEDDEDSLDGLTSYAALEPGVKEETSNHIPDDADDAEDASDQTSPPIGVNTVDDEAFEDVPF